MTIGNKKYLIAFLIAAAIFFSAFLVSNYFNQKRIDNIRNIEKKISTNILSLETQFELLQDASCKYIKENPVLSKELNSLAQKLSYTESQLGTDNPRVIKLKKSYSLLEIKDYLLMKKVDQKCKTDPVFTLYFYSNRDDCPECEQMGHILTHLRKNYPKLRVYSFDYHLNLSALKTLISIKNVEHDLPAIVVDGEVMHGFHSLEQVKEKLPMEKIKENTTSTNPVGR